MKIKLNRDKEEIEVTNLEIDLNGDVYFVVSINKFGQPVINKQSYEADSTIKILPSVSNEIRIE